MKKPKTDGHMFPTEVRDVCFTASNSEQLCFIPFVNIHFVKTKLTLSVMIQYMLGCVWKTNENIISNV